MPPCETSSIGAHVLDSLMF